ncbi:glycosyl transferase [Neiella marina]|uniref:Glycosyl transferase n=1 Tax=Neiella marina TaxID=508461 RepID=A0A8J2XPA5_9GAMM|nr:glycosyltransferase [Neiella marina]GGA78544.1 glycosyl transferase [Neiella marina]
MELSIDNAQLRNTVSPMLMETRKQSDFVIYSHFHLANIEVESIVGMAVYAGDRVDWVALAIESVLRQTYQDFLLCVVIDGPIAPDMRDLLTKLDKEQQRMVLIESETNLGLAACMNGVIDYANEFSPSFFFRMDSDDICFRGRLARQVKFFRDNPGVSVVGSSLVEIDEKGSSVGRRKMPKKHHEIMRFMPKRCSLNHPTIAIRYDVLEQGFRYNPQLQNTQDYFLWVDLAVAGFQFANINKPLLKFRRAKGFFKRRGLSKSFNEFRARLYAMKKLDRVSPGNLFYACSVFVIRMMPPPLLKFAYKLDRVLLHFLVRNK